jgi:hypothetical protein
MEALDGNAIAGDLFAAFGREMTTESGSCTNCGATSQVAELRVYTRAPGSVARCPHCDCVVMVLVEIRGATRIDAAGFQLGG